MHVTFAATRPPEAAILVLPVEKDGVARIPAGTLDEATLALARGAARAGRFDGEAGTLAEIFLPGGEEANRLVLLGVGWNFGFIGASALVLECHRPEERTRVQSLNDFLVFGTMAVGSFSSGSLLTAYGWDTVLWMSFIPLAMAVAALIVAASSRADRAAS